MNPWPYSRWVAHRGAGKLAPENTLAALRLGAHYGYRMFECDVKLSSDGVPFLLHDATLQRTTNGHGTAGDKDWSELSRLDAGSWHSRTFAGEPLPAFEQVARFCTGNGFLLNVEIKPTPGHEAETGSLVAQHAARLWHGQAVAPLLSSFRPESLQAAMAAEPQLPRALLLDTLWDGWFGVARALGCVGIVCNHALWSEETVATVKGAGMRCLSYTVNDEWAASRLIALGTDGIITDRVDLFSPA
ncbi:MAG TPA: glycerophosphodiester phosphodiesterase [Ramlibacter sp.]|uniref:glycerophosphodiester phosphodiesterase n=1 Tax=Ramlibacter sp. TaxID=1917967 RepID=UPI002BD7BA78|nr:glycerophosphodiester phosphodiesterase [Ramlibacter sp.]HVZ42425.1 glycerophosphodiester phosphodiesterase [Ramlibacter sp.]